MLLTRCPHLVLDGLQLALEAVGATAIYLYVKPGPAAESARAALSERVTQGWDRYPVRVVEAEQTFLAGEESAVLARISGRRALRFDKRRLIVHSGLDGRATLVQNVETLANLALIARYGRNDLTIPADLAGHAKQATHLCPRLALSVEPRR